MKQRLLAYGKRMSIVLVVLLVLFGAEALWFFYAPVTETWVASAEDEESMVDYTGYPNSQSVSAHLKKQADEYPDLMTLEEIGQSYLGKPIFAAILSHGEPNNKPATLLFAQQHGREAIGMLSAIYTIDHLLQNYGKDEFVTTLLDTRTICVIPQVNPDGNDMFLYKDYNFRGNANLMEEDKLLLATKDDIGLDAFFRWMVGFRRSWVIETNGKPWSVPDYQWPTDEDYKYTNVFLDKPQMVNRLNRPLDRGTREFVDGGVDLNRNWDAMWESGVGMPDVVTYRGASAWSEPETAALRDFVISHPNIVAALDIHSGVNSFLWPYSKTEAQVPEHDMFKQMGRKLSSLLTLEDAPFLHYQGRAIYRMPTFGSSQDWLYEQGIMAACLEIYRYPGSRTIEKRQLWPLPIYMDYWSLAHMANPGPRDIANIVNNRLEGLLYYISASPDVGIRSVETNQDSLDIRLVNTGLVPVDVLVEASQEQQKLGTWDLKQLAGEITLQLKQWTPSENICITIDPRGPVASFVREGELETVVIRVSDTGEIVLVDGALTADVDLSSHFGGWTADEAVWGTETYHKEVTTP